MDGRVNIPRIAQVLSEIDADIVALQEVYGAGVRDGQVEAIAETLALHSAFGLTRHHLGRPYGNAILSRWPIQQSCDMDISIAHRERRGCIRADIKTPRGTIHVYNIHMGTRYFERRRQVRALMSSPQLHDALTGPRVLVGDFNEWTNGLTTRMLSARFETLDTDLHVGRRRSFPGFLPMLRLDHIYFEKPLHIVKSEMVRTRLARAASDHLPLTATFSWSQAQADVSA